MNRRRRHWRRWGRDRLEQVIIGGDRFQQRVLARGQLGLEQFWREEGLHFWRRFWSCRFSLHRFRLWLPRLRRRLGRQKAGAPVAVLRGILGLGVVVVRLGQLRIAPGSGGCLLRGALRSRDHGGDDAHQARDHSCQPRNQQPRQAFGSRREERRVRSGAMRPDEESPAGAQRQADYEVNEPN
jgi:hypothetical protein